MDFNSTEKNELEKLEQVGVDSPDLISEEFDIIDQSVDESVKLISNSIMSEEEKKEYEETKRFVESVDRDRVWAFISGQFSQDFRGNPKYLFAYINKYRPDIKAYWVCSNDETIEQVRALNFHAYNLDSPSAQYLINRTGVLVTEQVKYAMPEGFHNIKYINLWHGVGFKKVERRLFLGDIAMTFAKKYIMRGTFYRDHQLMNATCPFIESAYTDDLGVDPDKFLRVGYPRCLYQQNFEPVVSFDHDLRKRKGLSKDAKLVVYAPTYRAKLGGTFSNAIKDFDALYSFCEKHNILFIFKVHPNMEKEVGFLKAWEQYGDRPHFLFWDNRDDFYEVMHTMDLAIYDYSSIVSEMIAMGIKHYIRYIFDYDEYMDTVSVYDNYFEMTTGKICYTFEELLKAMRWFKLRNEKSEIARLNKELWSYSEGKDDFERIINTAIDFKVEERKFPTLYSFDIFDTVFTRKVLDPVGIFYYVKEKMAQDGGFSAGTVRRYPKIRQTAELNVREYYAKSTKLRDSERVEISFDEIFERMADVYGFDDTQIEKLKTWELEAELDNVIPLPEQINKIKELLANNEKVVLISDMYLPKEFIEKLLYKADPVLTTLPMFLSNEYGVLKTSQKLYFEVYKSFKPYYDFEKWVHYGDNENADERQARQFQIHSRKVKKPEFNDLQSQLVKDAGTYDSYLVAAMQARLCDEFNSDKDRFVSSFIALCFVPYIDWVLRDAERKGYQTLYFISRDGYHLKRIADKIIKQRGLKFKTKYIYASRRTWRIPSFVHEVDDNFWEDYGSFGNIASKHKLLSAMDIEEEKFKELFPYLDLDSVDFSNKKEVDSLRDIFRNSAPYKEYLLETAAKERVIVNDYLRQEIDKDEKFVFVEYYGRGYTQDCLVNLWRDITGDDEAQIAFYYSRSVLPSANGAIRHNFTTNDGKQYFIESIFANMPYKSVQEYRRENGKIVPVIESIPYNKALFNSMDRILPIFAERYAALGLNDPEGTDEMLYDFLFDYYQSHVDDPDFASELGELKDSITLYGDKREFAPPYTMELLDRIEAKEVSRASLMVTTSMSMSVIRSDKDVQRRYFDMYQILPGDPLGSGRLLSPEEIEKNNSFRKKFERIKKRATAFKRLYENAVECNEVSDTILILSNSKKEADNQISLLEDGLKGIDNYTVKTILLGNCVSEGDADLAAEIAKARFIVVPEPIHLLCKTVLRDETKEIMALPVPFTLNNKGMIQEIFLKWEQKFKLITAKNDISTLQIPSAALEDFYRRCYVTRSDAEIKVAGSYLTDVYFDPEFKSQAEAKLTELFPEAAGKKRILYMPKWRTRADCPNWLEMLDLELLKELVGDEYVVIVRINKGQILHDTVNKFDLPGFSKLLNTGIGVRALMSTCDVVVGDYNDTFFETPIIRKPAFATTTDCERFISGRNRSYHINNYEQYQFCPVIKTSYELADHLKNIDNYDFAEMDQFKDKYLTMCDGHSVERLADYIKSIK